MRICWFDPEADSPLMVSDAFGDLCALFCESAESVWNDLRDTHNKGAALSEDSITDYLLLNMARSSPLLAYHRYTRHAESHVSGADWLWLFVSKGRGFPLLIQAKRIYPSMAYAALKHTPKGKRDQLNMLERYARKSGFFPLLCFYNFWNVSQPWAISRFSGHERLWGCAVARVNDVKRILRTSSANSAGTVGPVSLPWHLLVCPTAKVAHKAVSDQLPDRVRDNVIQLFGRYGVPAVREGLPHDIRELLASAPQILDIADAVSESLAGIVVISEEGLDNQ